ncbi:MAG: hypothetical protein EBX54_09560 [Betaproteobacteria bacterium]|nr:hypothetical protein [Betaproteobacteria bacterium]
MTTEIRNDEVGVFLARELETILARTFEVEYADKEDLAVDVGFRAVQREKLAQAFGLANLPEGPCDAVIWTTTPWTLPANQAHFESDAGQKLISRLPRRRIGKPEDLDAVLLMLASGRSGFVNGAVISADDGPT